jgi:hypothetical protein
VPGLRVAGKCSKCGHEVKTTAPAGKSTWRGPCPQDASHGTVIARRVRVDAPAAPEPPPEPTEPPRGHQRRRPLRAAGYTQRREPEPVPRADPADSNTADPVAPPGPGEPGGPPPAERPDDERPFTTGSTDRAPGGDPDKVATVLGGLFLIALGTVSFLARRRERQLRMPTPRQLEDIAQPLARIACRHLPMDALGPDLIDGTEALVAVHGYVLDGPLIEPADGPDVEIDVPEFITTGEDTSF